jgi:hypothetical protein
MLALIVGWWGRWRKFGISIICLLLKNRGVFGDKACSSVWDPTCNSFSGSGVHAWARNFDHYLGESYFVSAESPAME